MESIIKKLHFLGLENSIEKSKTKKAREQAFALYEKIEKTLSDEQREWLDDYATKTADFHADEEKEMYFRGFKTGVLLMVEVLNFEKEE